MKLHHVGGDAAATGLGAAGFLVILWLLTEYGHRKLRS